jgi:signal transduction histidine kinase
MFSNLRLHSLRLRLTLSHLAVIAVAMALSSFLLLSLVERYFLQALEDSLAVQARLTAQALIPGGSTAGPEVAAQSPASNAVQQNSLSNLQVQTQNLALPTSSDEFDLTYLSDVSLQLASQLETRLRLIDAQGTVLVDTGGDRGQSLRADPFIAPALKGEYARRVVAANGGAPAIMEVALPVSLDGRLVGVIYVSQLLRDTAAVLYDLRLRLLLSTGIAALLSGIIGLALSQAVARPVRRLTLAAQAVAGGDLDQQVPARSRDELGLLSRTFNEMTARLKSARQMQTDFVANVSHELRTPLTAMKGMLETLRDGAIDDPEVRDRFLGTVEEETDRLIRLVNDLLTLSRADSQVLDLRLEAVDLAQLTRRAIERLEPQAAARSVAVSIQAAGASMVHADPDRVEQILVNLLSNALQYSHAGGQVMVAIDPSDLSWARVRVQDQGIGIPTAELQRIGQRFYRADRARSRAAGGSGLGLAIARALVEAHGGQLHIDSQEGQGTQVTFTLPRFQGNQTQEAA